MQIRNRLYSGDAVKLIIMNAASYGDPSAADDQADAMASETSPKSSLPSALPQLESADDSTGDGDAEMADQDSPRHNLSKKRRLSAEQVRWLEMSFEEENKLEPERKLHLAKEVGLQPRQVAIWFQNRRARWKTKQLERDYDILRASYHSLLSEKEKLQDEIALLQVKLESNPRESNQAINRKDRPDSTFNQSNTYSEDLPCKTDASTLHLSDNLMLKQPCCESDDQQLHSPVSSNDASFDSNNGSLLTRTSDTAIHGLRVSSLHPADAISCDPKPAGELQSAKPGVGDPDHHLLVKEHLLGTLCNPQSHHQIAFKQEAANGFQEDSYTTTAFLTLDESTGWPWFWD